MGNYSQKEQKDEEKKEKVILRKGITKKQKQFVDNSPYIKELFHNETWHINFQDQTKNYSYALSLVDNPASVRTLSVSQQFSPSFLIQIVQLKFPKVRKLLLNYNNITSIDILTHSSFPLLEEISLEGNLLTNIKNLRKLSHKIEILSIRKNCITNLQDNKFTEVSFVEDVDSLNIEDNLQNCYGDDLRWLLKLPIKNAIRIQIHSKKRLGISIELSRMIKKLYGKQNETSFWVQKRVKRTGTNADDGYGYFRNL